MFTNRVEAGMLLAEKLINYSNNKDAIIVTIPRGGVPVAFEITKNLNLPLEIILSKKIGHPLNKEYAIGAVTLKNKILNDSIPGISELYIKEETKRVREILKQRFQRYYINRTPLNFKDKIVILVDDGVATGNTLLSSIELIHLEEPSSIIVALPVAPPGTLKKIKELPSVTTTICLLSPINFRAVGQFYEDFNQVSDVEVVELLKKASDNLALNYSNV